MKKLAILCIVVAPLVGVVLAEPPERAKNKDAGATTKSAADKEQGDAEAKVASKASARPKGQEWLKQLVGEWDLKFKISMDPDQPPMESPGTDSVRVHGAHWIITDTKTTMMGAPYHGILTLGYDAMKQQFNGTWIDSFGGYLWVYKGTLNDARDTLTLETSGPSPFNPGKNARYREVHHIVDKDNRTFTSSTETEDGKWTKILTVEYRRKK